MNWSQYYQFLLALTMWREASGEGVEGMRAVGHVVANEVKVTKLTWESVILNKWYISSMTAPGDPGTVRWPRYPDNSFVTATELAIEIYQGINTDNTDGATHYFNPHIVLPSWAKYMIKTVTIGNHDFYKEAPVPHFVEIAEVT